MAGGGAKPGERRGGRQKGTPNKVNATTREQIWAEIERRAAAGQQVNPFVVAMDLIATTGDDRVRLHAAEFLGDRLLPKLKAVEHGGEVGHNVMVIHHRYGRSEHPSRESHTVTASR